MFMMMMMMMNFRPIAAYRRTQRSSLQLGLWVDGHLVLTDFCPEEPEWTLVIASTVDDSTINIVMAIMIIMIIILISPVSGDFHISVHTKLAVV